MTDTSVAFVRTESIPPSPPPAAEQGIVKWLRDNLFSSVTNGVLTLLAIVAIYYVLALILPWIFNGVWDTSSRRECLDRLDGAIGGCFSVLAERWHQLIFGRYPIDSYWRPILTFLLLIVAIAPVLFSSVPRKLLIWTGLFPFVAYWLVWGGTILSPLAVLIGVGIGYLVYQRLVNQSFANGLRRRHRRRACLLGARRGRSGGRTATGPGAQGRRIARYRRVHVEHDHSASSACRCPCRWASPLRWVGNPRCRSSSSSR